MQTTNKFALISCQHLFRS